MCVWGCQWCERLTAVQSPLLEETPLAVIIFSICSSLFCNGEVACVVPMLVLWSGVLTIEGENVLKHGLNALSWRWLRDLPSLLVLPSSGGFEEQPRVCVRLCVCDRMTKLRVKHAARVNLNLISFGVFCIISQNWISTETGKQRGKRPRGEPEVKLGLVPRASSVSETA